MRNSSPQKSKEKTEEKGFRAYFLRLFGKYDFRNEEQFVTFAKWLIFIVLLFVEALIFMEHFARFSASGGWKTFIFLCVISVVLTVSESMKLFIVKRSKGRTVFYVLDALAAFCFLFVTSGVYPIVVYILVLTEFYIGAEGTLPSIILLCIAAPIYAGGYVLYQYSRLGVALQLYEVLTKSFSHIFIFIAHFVVVKIALAFYRQFLRLDKALSELDEKRKELEKAYAVVAEVAALEERQRIAKEIHDTAGHSLTTVIMQTEAAKLIIDKSPEEAKQKLVAANLQAKHALEELRDSVHLLSGQKQNETLKTALEGVLHESTDGTGIVIRSDIDEICVSSAKFRFLCNTLKEGISNGLRHGGATAFYFELKQESDKIRFLLSDNGKGVKKAEFKLGFGLSTMQERARALGGEVFFEWEEDEGFELTLILPKDKGEE